MKKSILVALTAAVALAFGASTYAEEKKAEAKPAEKAAAPATEKKAEAKPAEKKAEAKPAEKEKSVTGMVEKGKADGSWVIKAGKKTYNVDPASPKAADVATFAGKDVEAKGMVKKDDKGAMTISVTDVKTAPEKKAKPAEKKAEAKPAEAKPAEAKPAEKK